MESHNEKKTPARQKKKKRSKKKQKEIFIFAIVLVLIVPTSVLPLLFFSHNTPAHKDHAANKEQYTDGGKDLREFGISSRRIRQTKEFTSGSSMAWERSSQSTAQSAVKGLFARDLQIAGKDVSDSIGIRMLREMGWRQGRAVGLTTIREPKKHCDLDDVDREQITKVAPHWVASAEDEEVIHLDPVEGKKGLGYSGELKGSGLLSEKYGQSAAVLKGKGRGIRGQAFGVGTFEYEDKSVYTSFDLSQYDFALGPAAPEVRDKTRDSSFVPARCVRSSRKFYGAPKIPATFKGIHVVKRVDASALPSRMKSTIEGLTSQQRTQFLGENRTNEGGVRKKKSRWDVKSEEKEGEEEEDYERRERERRREREESRNAERAKRIEYPNDGNKQRRFMEYLNYVRRGLAMPQPADISHWEWEHEEVEFESKLLPDERALLPDVRARTKPLAKSALALPILDMMRSKFVGETNAPHMTSSRDEDRMMAVRSEMLEEKICTIRFHPNSPFSCIVGIFFVAATLFCKSYIAWVCMTRIKRGRRKRGRLPYPPTKLPYSSLRSRRKAYARVRNVDIDLDEFQGEIEDIVRRKCEAAAEKVEGFVMVEDTSLCFNALGGLPGPYIKWFLKKLGPSGLHQMLSGYEDKGAQAVCAMAFTHGKGLPITVIKGVCEGQIVSPRGPNTFGWDPCFEPLDTGKTFAEMSSEEKNAISHRSKALAALREALEKN